METDTFVSYAPCNNSYSWVPSWISNNVIMRLILLGRVDRAGHSFRLLRPTAIFNMKLKNTNTLKIFY